MNGDGTEDRIDAELELTRPRLIDDLSGAGGITATVTPEIARLKDTRGEPVLVPWQTAVYAEHSGQIRAGGLVTDLEIDGPDLSLNCLGHTGYLHGLPYLGAITYYGADPLDMARHLWAHAQGFEGGNLGLTVDTTKSPVMIGTPPFAPTRGQVTDRVWDWLLSLGWRPTDKTGRLYPPGERAANGSIPNDTYKLNWWDTKDMGKEFDDLAHNTPFDYRVSHRWDGDTVRHDLIFGYPRLGTRKAGLRFMVGENVFTDPEVNYRGERYASEVYVHAAGEGRKKLRGYDSRATDRLRRVAIVEAPGIGRKATADKAATRHLSALLGLHDIDTLHVTDHPNAPLGEYTVGDEILVQAPHGWAGELALWVRVLSITIDPEADVSTLTVARAEKVS